MKRNNENLSLSDVLKEFVHENKLEKGLNKVHVRDAWGNQMGPAIKKYTTNIQLKNTTLYVQLSSSVLRQELSYGKEKIINMLNKELGEDLIKKLVLC
ncbi:DUF721 domain-containing protein [Zunongwangia sp.]|uniref:DUF721 domain-containing protein n=1 Tax=Zunongwangia sp. TaxID=1965325 RepID=UPI003AA80F22